MRWFRQLVFGGALVAAAHGQVVLDFQDLILVDYGDIPTNYGSNLTPNLAGISYRTYDPVTNVTVAPQLDFWNNDYGDLTKVAFAISNGAAAEISFNPASGYAVRLISFDMAGWPNVDRSLYLLRVTDGQGSILFDFAANGPVAIEGDFLGARHSTFTPNLVAPGTLRIQWGTDWNVGIDNIQFQIVPIPEPPVWALLAMGGLIAGWRMRRSRRTRTRDAGRFAGPT